MYSFEVFTLIRVNNLNTLFILSKEEMELDFEVKDINEESSRQAALNQLVATQAKFLEEAKDVMTSQLLNSMAQLCHMDTQLAEVVWLDLFPRLWSILNNRQQEVWMKTVMYCVLNYHFVVSVFWLQVLWTKNNTEIIRY